jgi:hypothetical protein
MSVVEKSEIFGFRPTRPLVGTKLDFPRNKKHNKGNRYDVSNLVGSRISVIGPGLNMQIYQCGAKSSNSRLWSQEEMKSNTKECKDNYSSLYTFN